ncbi:2-pyrone-4,6-dicarbaxylate hydrolase [Paraburkholderia hiiakae]|uniref:2-pyrone-4,6-dicarbaxylate hydrolase n=1 Tax=Paraburkholderia hiiakae TaxID=1081782 RepID=A0ABM8NED2_9BURK|nr:amidohydrolase family protein [Paraburkholderia hiiakae]CAD6520173.1 2-pyrone-4,6-dicarbaxylate hydrolase [Paraburkholderia hiiakae]
MATTTETPLVSTPMRDCETLARPAFVVADLACDAHMHVFGPLDQYPCVARPHYTLPDGKLDHYLRLMEVLELKRFVIVQPSFYGTDNRCMIDALKAAGPIARGVAMIEEDTDTTTLERFHEAGVRAVRLDLFARSGLPTAEIQQYITRMARRCASLGWHLQFYAPGWVVRNLIPFLADVQTDFVIDHMGYMLEEDGLTEDDFARLLGLLREGNCWLKLSAPYRIAKHRGYDAVAPMAKGIIAAAPHKVIWGSDWPHIPDGSRDTGELLNLLAQWTGDADVQRAILADNPARLFDF